MSVYKKIYSCNFTVTPVNILLTKVVEAPLFTLPQQSFLSAFLSNILYVLSRYVQKYKERNQLEKLSDAVHAALHVRVNTVV